MRSAVFAAFVFDGVEAEDFEFGPIETNMKESRS